MSDIASLLHRAADMLDHSSSRLEGRQSLIVELFQAADRLGEEEKMVERGALAVYAADFPDYPFDGASELMRDDYLTGARICLRAAMGGE